MDNNGKGLLTNGADESVAEDHIDSHTVTEGVGSVVGELTSGENGIAIVVQSETAGESIQNGAIVETTESVDNLKITTTDTTDQHSDNCDAPNIKQLPNSENSATTLSSPDLTTAIVTQIEYYFSDENLVKDRFIQQQISRDKNGFVPLSLIATFNRMKKLTTDVSIIAEALRSSTKLELNKPGTKVRRTTPPPLTKEDEAAQRTVVATNLSDTTSEGISKRFSSCGNVVRVRVVARDETVPGDARKYLRREIDGHGKAATSMALIEYENQESAHLACERLTDASDWRRGLHVAMLVPPSVERKTASKSIESNSTAETKPKGGEHNPLTVETKSPHQQQADSLSPNAPEPKVKKKAKNKKHFRVNELAQGESPGYSSSGSETEGQEASHQETNRRRSSPVGRGLRASSPRATSTGSPNDSPKFGRRSGAHGKSPLIEDALLGEQRTRSGSTGAIDYTNQTPSPWVARRIKAAQHESENKTNSMTDLTAGDSAAISSKKVESGVVVLRQPKGPDGTKGFIMAR